MIKPSISYFCLKDLILNFDSSRPNKHNNIIFNCIKKFQLTKKFVSPKYFFATLMDNIYFDCKEATRLNNLFITDNNDIIITCQHQMKNQVPKCFNELNTILCTNIDLFNIETYSNFDIFLLNRIADAELFYLIENGDWTEEFYSNLGDDISKISLFHIYTANIKLYTQSSPQSKQKVGEIIDLYVLLNIIFQ